MHDGDNHAPSVRRCDGWVYAERHDDDHGPSDDYDDDPADHDDDDGPADHDDDVNRAHEHPVDRANPDHHDDDGLADHYHLHHDSTDHHDDHDPASGSRPGDRDGSAPRSRRRTGPAGLYRHLRPTDQYLTPYRRSGRPRANGVG
jgi:hypothetical protein